MTIGAIDPAKVRKAPAEWAEEEGMVIIEPIGWINNGLSVDTPVIYATYHSLALMSVLGPAAGTPIELAFQTKEDA